LKIQCKKMKDVEKFYKVEILEFQHVIGISFKFYERLVIFVPARPFRILMMCRLRWFEEVSA